MVDHGRLQREVTLFIHHRLIVRLTVFPRIYDIPLLHGFFRFVKSPCLRLYGRHPDVIKGIHRNEHCHGCSRRKVDPVHRLLEDYHVAVQIFRYLSAFRNEQESLAVVDIDDRVSIFVVIDAELSRSVELELRLKCQTFDLRRGRIRLLFTFRALAAAARASCQHTCRNNEQAEHEAYKSRFGFVFSKFHVKLLRSLVLLQFFIFVFIGEGFVYCLCLFFLSIDSAVDFDPFGFCVCVLLIC